MARRTRSLPKRWQLVICLMNKSMSSSTPTIVVAVTLEKFLGLDPDASAEVIGGGPIADSTLAEYMHDANIISMLFGQQGQPLWMSRQIRLANMAHNSHSSSETNDACYATPTTPNPQQPPHHLQGPCRRPLETTPSPPPRNNTTTTTQTKPCTSAPTHLEHQDR